MSFVPGETIKAFGIQPIRENNSASIIPTIGDEFDALTGMTDTASGGQWRTHNFEVAMHHTYVAQGLRVHNTSPNSYTLDEDGELETLYDTDGSEVEVLGSWTPSQAYHYGQIAERQNPDGSVSKVLTSGGMLESLSATGRSFADLIGLDGRFGLQGTFANEDEGLPPDFHESGHAPEHRVDWSGDKDDDDTPDWRDEDYSNIGNWGGDRDNDGVPNWRDRNDGVGWRDKNGDRDSDTNGSGKPIVLDMDGDGIEIQIEGNVSFDMDADGFAENTAWVTPDDAFLVIDLNADGSRGSGDGKIDQTQELVLTEWFDSEGITDLQALAMFDVVADLGGNNDGVISDQDTIWNELRVWQDADSNGLADDGELKTLDQLGFSQINLTYDDGTAYDDNRNDVEIFGSKLLGTASYTRNGEVVAGGVGDVALSYDAQGVRTIETDDELRFDFESGEIHVYAKLENRQSADFSLSTTSFQGVQGDNRDNVISAVGSTFGVNIFGENGNDTLLGGQGNDNLFGGDGDDYLTSGSDDLSGIDRMGAIWVDQNPDRLIVGDYDGNGVDDRSVFWRDDGANRHFLGHADGSATRNVDLLSRASVDQDPKRYIAGDFNGDGRDDFAIVWHVSGQNRFFFNEDDGTIDQEFELLDRAAVDQKQSSMISGDFDGDGLDDLMFHWESSGVNRIFYGKHDKTFAHDFDPIEREFIKGNGESVEVRSGDFDGDGRDDIAFFWSSIGQVRVVYADGSKGFEQYYLASNGSALEGMNVFLAGDFDGDGIDDLFFGAETTGENWTVFGDVNRNTYFLIDQFSRDFIATPATLWEAGDFNGDGADEIVWLDGSTGENQYGNLINSDTLSGGAEDDHLVMEDGNVTASGGVGADTFEFLGGEGVVADFEVGLDTIDLSAFAVSWSTLNMTTDEGISTVWLDDEKLVIQADGTLTADDFLFA
ncbi:FG-GAP-like repeat-containing protein [Cognatiyoonia sp. IB215182]|nr:FG-GAP-like repeat-containing protein [Cognatiyoonia sp. IB215182]